MPRDPGERVGLGALGFAGLLLLLVLVRGFLSTSPMTNPTMGPVGPFTGNSTPVAPIIVPTINPTGGPRPTSGPIPNPGLLTQVITLASAPPSGAAYGGSYLPVAQRGASGNPVLFTSLSTGVCKSVVGNTFDFVGVGNCLIQASEAGNARYSSATIAMSFLVGQASQYIEYTSAPPGSPSIGGTYTIRATAQGGTVTFSADAVGGACSVSPSGSVSFTAAGACVIDATQGGSVDYSAAPSVQQQFDVPPAS
jgi:hypothetical protein